MTNVYKLRFQLRVVATLLAVLAAGHWAFGADQARPDVSIASFEGKDYGDWQATGEAFGAAPASGSVPGGMGAVFNYDGAQLVNSFANSDRDGAVGTLTSPEFVLERRYLAFSIGGGKFPGETGIDLYVDGEKVASETGLYNVSRQGDEGLARRFWDVDAYQGKKARLVIYDHKAGGDWGHIKVDRIYQTDVAPTAEHELVVAPNAAPLEYNRMIFGQFIEHFHRQIYGGIFEPGSPLADETGFRLDVVEALKELRVPIVRWPGGCFVSAYHWLDGVGPDRSPSYDKAWHVEEPNTFGTAEYVQWCRMIGAEPYICTNAGTGTPEEMSDWVEYCNLNVGKFGRLRKSHGYDEPFNVKYWSVGNENWGGHEMGAKTVAEWGPLVRESSKLMINTDPTIKLFAAALPDENWTLPLLQAAGRYLDYVSIHGYWTWLRQGGAPAPYLDCMMKTDAPEAEILRTINILERAGMRGRVKIAFDEWNLRGWHHPGMGDPKHIDFKAREKNDDNSVYTMADALFAACFLNSCLRHCDDVEIACFSPIVNVRGALYAYPGGIVKRPTFHVFKLYSDLLEKNRLPIDVFSAPLRDGQRATKTVDAVLTCNDARDRFALALVNKDPASPASLALRLPDGVALPDCVDATILRGSSPDDYNDVGREESVAPEKVRLEIVDGRVSLPAHSLVVITVGK